MSVEKTLIGKHLIVPPVGGENYVFSLPTTPAGSNLPNQLDNQVIEEVYIGVDTSLGGASIYLPPISSFNLAWGAKIYITVIDNTNGVDIFPYSSEVSASDTLNGNSVLSSSVQWDSWYLHIVNENTWMALFCPGPAVVPPPIV